MWCGGLTNVYLTWKSNLNSIVEETMVAYYDVNVMCVSGNGALHSWLVFFDAA